MKRKKAYSNTKPNLLVIKAVKIIQSFQIQLAMRRSKNISDLGSPSMQKSHKVVDTFGTGGAFGFFFSLL